MRGLTKHLLNGIKVPFILLFAWMAFLGVKGLFSESSEIGADIGIIVVGLGFGFLLGASFYWRRKNIIIEYTPFDFELGDKVEVLVAEEWMPATVEFVAGKGIRDEKFDWVLAEDLKGIVVAWDDPEAAIQRITELVENGVKDQEGARLEILVIQANDPRVLRRR